LRGLGEVERRVLNTRMNINRTDRPFILFNQRCIDFAAAMSGIRTQRTTRRGNISRNIRDITARVMDKTSFARGSNLCMIES